MCVRDTNEVHISVQAAEYGEIAGKRIDIMAFAVVNQNSQAVRTAGRAEICDVETKSGISTTMLAQKFVVQICAAHGVGGLKFQDVYKRQPYHHLWGCHTQDAQAQGDLL